MVNTLFVSYPGEPINPTTFIPDNGLASLAATAIGKGGKAFIIDYGTVDMLRKSFPESVRNDLEEIFTKKKINQLDKADQEKILSLDKIINKHREEELEKIGIEINKTISEKKIDFVNFKAWMGEAYPGLLRLTELIKRENRDIPILAGGPHIVSFGDVILEQGKNIDYLCYDEGEPTISKFIDFLHGKNTIEDVPNLLFKKKESLVKTQHEIVENLDTLPLPIYDKEVYSAMSNNQKFNMIVIDESRRCFYSCPFCIESSKEKSKWRAKTPQRIIDEIKNVNEKYGTSLIRFGGQMTPGKLMEEVSRLIVEEGLEIEFSSFSHISTMKDADFDLMRKAGLYSLFFGVESGNQRMLSTTLGKKTKVEDIEYVLKKAGDAGIYTVASLIYPAPGDDNETLRDTVDLLVRAGVKSAPVQFAGVYPNTTWFNENEKYGFQLNKETYRKDTVDYTIKNIFPPQFWDAIPVKIGDKTFHEYIVDTGKMIYALESNGILSDITDEQALLAEHIGIEPRELRDESSRIIFTGDWKKMHEYVKKVNG